MKRLRGAIVLLVLPTEDLLVGMRVTDEVLARVELSLKGLVETVVRYWAEVETGWGTHGCNYLPLDATVPERVRQAIVDDYLPDTVMDRLAPSEQTAIYRTISAAVTMVFDAVVPVLEELNLTDHQLQTLKCHSWLGPSLVIDVQH